MSSIGLDRHDATDRLKRAFDIAVALPMLAAIAPVMLAAMLAIRLTSPGPAVFSQTRMGRDGVAFRCHKLRTMAAGTPSLPTHEAPAAAVTPLGSLLRRSKLDEFPQLWNVLKGEMSLVGPRPCLPTQAELIGHRRDHGVLALRPGITGLAQARGIDMSDPALCARTDGAYLRHRSIALDLRILRATFLGGDVPVD